MSLPFLLIAAGYAGLIYVVGPIGIAVAAIHIGVMLVAAWMKGRLK